ncbi:hypothetical protein [Bradyrhizobium sp. ERR14]|uniref:hypothetical protein n=1 Tax=Bradyrhizobium sp. ERR14 TaxID=2663837 RepID=UPI00160A6614|nr:hypothetical protein [Bradyrhizobium sp. ERR14]MBB4396969.1 hypothetical protein [Bradyrhizobium sp. ERR14]
MSAKPEGAALGREREELLEKVGKIVFPQAALKLLRDGLISIEGRTDEQIVDDVLSYLRSNLKNTTFGLVTDHATSILPEARKFFRQGELELSALYFATYYEHRLNWIIVQICETKRIDPRIIKQLLREASMRAKCTWVMALLELSPFPKEKLKAIDEISEVRNSFIHYKWPIESGDANTSQSSREQILTSLNKAESIVRYLRDFEQRHLYKGQGHRLLRALAKRRRGSHTSEPI